MHSFRKISILNTESECFMLKKLLKCSIYFSFICSWLIINAMDFESEVDAGLNTPSLVKAHKNMAEQDSW